MAASADSWCAALPPATGWLLALGLGHVAGLGILWRAIAGRVPVRITGRADPAAILAALAAEPPMSHVSLVPAQLARLLDAAGDAAPPPALRAVLLGGGPIPPALVTRAIRAGWPVVPTYGLSETGSGATALATAEALDHPGSAGRPLPGVRVTIEEPDADGVGEIVVETAARFSGYLGDPPPAALATERVRTGDLGRLDDDGRLFVVDRRLDRIVRGGENIAPAEVEAVLLAHPAIADAAVVALADPLWGHVPAAAIVLASGAPDPGDESLTAHCRASLAGFKVPVSFLRLDALPRTSGGKLRREAVRALLAGERTGVLARPDGAGIGWRVTGEGSLPLLLLHGTLSSAQQLDRLAVTLARPGDITVHALDRRGSGTGRLAPGAPVAGLDLAVHLADIIAYLDARGIARAAVVGVSFGGVLGVETGGATPGSCRGGRGLRAAVRAAGRCGDEGRVRDAGPGHRRRPPDRRPRRRRRDLHARGRGRCGLGPAVGAKPGIPRARGGRRRRRCRPRRRPPGGPRIHHRPGDHPHGGRQRTVLRADRGRPRRRIPGARRDTLEGLSHPSPITQPTPVAAAVRAALASAGLVIDPPSAPEPSAATDPEPPA